MYFECLNPTVFREYINYLHFDELKITHDNLIDLYCIASVCCDRFIEEKCSKYLIII